jgi:hypothetical protein
VRGWGVKYDWNVGQAVMVMIPVYERLHQDRSIYKYRVVFERGSMLPHVHDTGIPFITNLSV